MKITELLLHRVTSWIVLVIGITLCLLAWTRVAERIEHQTHRQLADRAEDIRGNVERRVQRYFDMLRGFQAYFHSSEEVTRAEFRNYVQSLDLPRNYPGVQAVQFARLVTQAEKAAFERRVRAAGYPHFAIHPPGERAEYVAVKFNEPMQGNEPAFGHDQIFEAKRRDAMIRARDSGEPATSAPIVLIQDGVGAPAVVLRMPVYRSGSTPTSVDERRSAFAGQLTGLFRISDLMAGVVSASALDGAMLRIRDMSATDQGLPGERLLEIGAAQLMHPSVMTIVHTGSSVFKVGSRYWQLELERASTRALWQLGPLALLVGGLMGSLLVFVTLRNLARHHRAATELAGRMTARCRESEKQYRTIVDNIHEVVFQLDTRRGWSYLNPAWEELTGYSVRECIGWRAVDVLYPEDRSAVLDDFERLERRETETCRRTVRLVTKADGPRWVEINAHARFTDSGEYAGLSGILANVTERVHAEQALQRLAHHDPLTGLLNRTFFDERAHALIGASLAASRPIGMIFIDVDRFKVINDVHGHLAGDAALREVARRIRQCVRASDTIARVGGDEFVVLVADMSSIDDTLRVAAELHAQLERPFSYAGRSIAIEASLGVAAAPRDGTSLTELLSAADAAMYRAKREGRNGYRVADGAPALRVV